MLRIDHPENVGQLEAAESAEMMTGEDVSVRDMMCEEPPIMDISGDGEPAKETTPPGVFVEGLLRRSTAPKPDPKIASSIKIELPTDPKPLEWSAILTSSLGTRRGCKGPIQWSSGLTRTWSP